MRFCQEKRGGRAASNFDWKREKGCYAAVSPRSFLTIVASEISLHDIRYTLDYGINPLQIHSHSGKVINFKSTLYKGSKQSVS